MKKRIVNVSKFVCAFMFVALLVSSIIFASYETSLNVKSQKLQDEITDLESSKASLELQVQEATSFSKIEEIANKNGYTYRQSNSTASIVTTEE